MTGLDGMKGLIKVSTKTLLEEPRAELTALHTMTLLVPAGLLTKACCTRPTRDSGLPRLLMCNEVDDMTVSSLRTRKACHTVEMLEGIPICCDQVKNITSCT